MLQSAYLEWGDPIWTFPWIRYRCSFRLTIASTTFFAFLFSSVSAKCFRLHPLRDCTSTLVGPYTTSSSLRRKARTCQLRYLPLIDRTSFGFSTWMPAHCCPWWQAFSSLTLVCVERRFPWKIMSNYPKKWSLILLVISLERLWLHAFLFY